MFVVFLLEKESISVGGWLDCGEKWVGVHGWGRSLRGYLASPTAITPAFAEANRKENEESCHRWATFPILSQTKNPLGKKGSGRVSSPPTRSPLVLFLTSGFMGKFELDNFRENNLELIWLTPYSNTLNCIPLSLWGTGISLLRIVGEVGLAQKKSLDVRLCKSLRYTLSGAYAGGKLK